MEDPRIKFFSHKKTEVKSKFSSGAVTQALLEKKEMNREKTLNIPDELKQKYFINLPYFNFIYAEEELGFSFTDFAKNNFNDFLTTCYLHDLISLRKNYILRNMSQVRFLAHKFKSPFGYISFYSG